MVRQNHREEHRGVPKGGTLAGRTASKRERACSSCARARLSGDRAGKARRFRVVGLDISKTFVAIASANAKDAGAAVEFHQGNAAEMPFGAESFDLIVCRAAFKNFAEPVASDSRDVSRAQARGTGPHHRPAARRFARRSIATEVDRMNLGWLELVYRRG